jgi:Rrf2 family protein
MQLVVQSGDLGPKWFHLAIRALVLLAESEALVKSNQIAERLGGDPTVIRKILTRLAQAELVASTAGRYGGYSLKKSPGDVTIKDIYQAFDTAEPVPYWSVPSTGTEIYISQIVAKAEEQFQQTLADFTIEDLLMLKK